MTVTHEPTGTVPAVVTPVRRRQAILDSLNGWGGVAMATAVVVAAIAIAIGQHWLTFASILPLLYVLPCAAMMLMCMRRH